MWLRTRSFLLLGLFVLLQTNVWGEKLPDDYYEGNERVFQLQKCVEQLIEKMLNVIEDFYTKVRNKYKCIPEDVPNAIMEILKHSIDCLSINEKKLQNARLTKNTHRKLFHRCLAQGRKELQDLMNGIDPTLNYCPENMTEKIYQINITTSFSKTFNINIQNGLEITRKIIYSENDTLDEDAAQSVLQNEGEQKEKFDGDEYAEYDLPKDHHGNEEYIHDQPNPKVDSAAKYERGTTKSSVENILKRNRRRKRNK